MIKDITNDFGILVGTLLEHFESPKKWNYFLRLYKNVPISHVRISNAKRNYINAEKYYINFFKEAGEVKLRNLVKTIANEIVNWDIFTVEEEHKFIAHLEKIIPAEDIVIVQHIIHLGKILTFADDLDTQNKFSDPIVANIDKQNIISIHPGKKRINVLEYLYLRDKKEYYFDVLLYKDKAADNSGNFDGFFIDKPYVYIKSFQDFANIYGYNSIAEFLLAIKRGQSTLCMNNGNEYYLTKATSYPYKKYLEKFEIIIEMAKS